MIETEKLFKLLHDESKEGWDFFINQYSSLVLSTISHFVDDYDDKMDIYLFVCQALAANDLRKLKQFKIRKGKTKGKFSTWLVLVVKNLCVDWFRKRDGRKRLFRSIERLTQLDQMVFEYCYLRGYSYHESYEIIKPELQQQVTFNDISKSVYRINKELSKKNQWKIISDLMKSVPQKSINAFRQGERSSVEILDTSKIPERLMLRKEIRTILDEAMNQLSAKDRLILKLRFEYALSAKEIASILRIEDYLTIYGKLNQLFTVLKKQLEAKEISWEDLVCIEEEQSNF